MNAPPATSTPAPDLPRRAAAIFRQETGQSIGLWALVAALGFATQIVFRRNLAPGEFGTLNTALGVLGLVTVPVAALDLAYTSYGNLSSAKIPRARVEALREALLLVTESFAWIWAAIALILLFPALPLLDLPRHPLQLLTILNIPVAVGAVLGWGFAPWTGGPFSYVDTLGAPAFLAICERLAVSVGERFTPNDLLRRAARDDATLYSP